LLTAITAVGVLLCAILLFSMGPEGHGIVGKEVDDAVISATTNCGFHIVKSESTPPENVTLTKKAALKHFAKQIAASLGLAMRIEDRATKYKVATHNDGARIYCLVRCSGDPVIGVTMQSSVVSRSEAIRLQGALAKGFQNHQVIMKNDAE